MVTWKQKLTRNVNQYNLRYFKYGLKFGKLVFV